MARSQHDADQDEAELGEVARGVAGGLARGVDGSGARCLARVRSSCSAAVQAGEGEETGVVAPRGREQGRWRQRFYSGARLGF